MILKSEKEDNKSEKFLEEDYQFLHQLVTDGIIKVASNRNQILMVINHETLIKNKIKSIESERNKLLEGVGKTEKK